MSTINREIEKKLWDAIHLIDSARDDFHGLNTEGLANANELLLTIKDAVAEAHRACDSMAVVQLAEGNLPPSCISVNWRAVREFTTEKQ